MKCGAVWCRAVWCGGHDAQPHTQREGEREKRNGVREKQMRITHAQRETACKHVLPRTQAHKHTSTHTYTSTHVHMFSVSMRIETRHSLFDSATFITMSSSRSSSSASAWHPSGALAQVRSPAKFHRYLNKRLLSVRKLLTPILHALHVCNSL